MRPSVAAMEENGKLDKDENGDAAREVIRGNDDMDGTKSGLVCSVRWLRLLDVMQESVVLKSSRLMDLMSGNGEDCGGEALLLLMVVRCGDVLQG